MKKFSICIILFSGFFSYSIFGSAYSSKVSFINNLTANGGLIISASAGANYECIKGITSSFPYNWGTQALSSTQDIPILTGTIQTQDFNSCDNPSYTSEGFSFQYQPPGSSGTFYLGNFFVNISNTGTATYETYNPISSWFNIKIISTGNNQVTVILSGAPDQGQHS